MLEVKCTELWLKVKVCGAGFTNTVVCFCKRSVFRIRAVPSFALQEGFSR